MLNQNRLKQTNLHSDKHVTKPIWLTFFDYTSHKGHSFQ